MKANLKKLGFLLLTTVFLLLSCTNNDYSAFLSPEEGRYGLYIVVDPEKEEDEITHEVLRENNIRNVSNFSGTTSLENSSLSEIEEVPTYIVFDTEEKVYETHSREELFEFSQEKSIRRVAEMVLGGVTFSAIFFFGVNK